MQSTVHLRHRSRPFALLCLLLSLVLCQSCANDQFEPGGIVDRDVPFAVTDLAIVVANDTIRLTWTATGDDGPIGSAHRYDLRWHSDPITAENWAEATAIPGTPAPGIAGTLEVFAFPIDPTMETVFVALQVVDENGNRSGLSNLVFMDQQPPTPVVDLTAKRVADQAVTLTWTAPTDDSPLGRADKYEIRYSEAPVTTGNWTEVLPRNGPLKPADGGEGETFAVRGLQPTTHYYLAIRSRDEAGNLSGLSNVLEFDTAQTPLGWWDGFAGQGIAGNAGNFYATEDSLYIGGKFTQAGDVVTRGIAVWDGNSFHSLGRGLAGGNYGPRADRMVVYNGNLHVGGSFSIAGNQPAPNIARWTAEGWQSLGDGPAYYPTSALGVHNGDLYLGGGFSEGPNSPFNYLTRYDGSTFHSMGWRPESYDIVIGLLSHNGLLVVTGGFTEAPGIPDARSIAMWNGTGWSKPMPDLVGIFGEPFIVAMCEYEGDLIVAGDLLTAGGVRLNHIARWDGTTWHPLGPGLGGNKDFVSSLTVYRGYLVAGGKFEKAGEEIVNNIAIWDGAYWSALGEGVLGTSPGPFPVQALASHQGSLYVGGSFHTAGGMPAQNIARWDLD